MSWVTDKKVVGRGIMCGLPVVLVEFEGKDVVSATNPITGFILDLFVDMFGFDGEILWYDEGEYWRALWCWLTGKDDEGGGAQ